MDTQAIFLWAVRCPQGASELPTAAATQQYDCEISKSSLALVLVMAGSDVPHREQAVTFRF